ncbi:hypothetical protein [Limoniibacter endophyticus]|uniref:Uncharacterized protein n=1 Tax=Limoniibacter endophyticus TaxID=1565040 RepID=A0A8J3DHB5_9HYPH|nr:hypothetical protein [Limoniibacter endophyticus]GHC66681.1 hypothetical protein GCM10010136_09960 [Limoniibacter endophyticus]
MVSLEREYDGTVRTFAIKDHSLFERLTPTGSTYELLNKFTSGKWTSGDVAFVISYALHGPSREVLQHQKIMSRMKIGVFSHPLWSPVPHLIYSPHPDVVATVSKAPGNYAPIAVDILTELIFGAGASVEADDE